MSLIRRESLSQFCKQCFPDSERPQKPTQILNNGALAPGGASRCSCLIGKVQGSPLSPLQAPCPVGLLPCVSGSVCRTLSSPGPTRPLCPPHALESSTCLSLNVIVWIQPMRADVRELIVTSERIFDKSLCGKRKPIAALGPSLETFGS